MAERSLPEQKTVVAAVIDIRQIPVGALPLFQQAAGEMDCSCQKVAGQGDYFSPRSDTDPLERVREGYVAVVIAGPRRAYE